MKDHVHNDELVVISSNQTNINTCVVRGVIDLLEKRCYHIAEQSIQ